MKKLLSNSALCILLVSLAGGVFGQAVETINYRYGDVYVGETLNGEPHGGGTFTTNSGTRYVGEFENGKRHGQGRMTYACHPNLACTGTILNGTWENGNFRKENNLPLLDVPNAAGIAIAKTEVTEIGASELLQAASGSGFAVSYEGHIITNNHVIEGCENVRLHRNGSVVDAVVVSRDPLNDLAVIQADFTPSIVFPIDNRNPQLMQDIYVAGYPFGENISSSLKVTRGIVSSLTGLGNNFSNMQIDAAIQPGNSGGPIFNNDGNVIGVAVATLDVAAALESFGTIPQNTNFGVKANIVSNFLISNGVEPIESNASSMTTSELGQLATDATYYLSCWMTTAQIQQMSSTKVMFQDLSQ